MFSASASDVRRRLAGRIGGEHRLFGGHIGKRVFALSLNAMPRGDESDIPGPWLIGWMAPKASDATRIHGVVVSAWTILCCGVFAVGAASQFLSLLFDQDHGDAGLMWPAALGILLGIPLTWFSQEAKCLVALVPTIIEEQPPL